MIKNNLIVLLIVSIGLMAIISGCTGGQDVTSVVKALPEVQQFMNEHPNAKITVTYWSKEEVTQSLQEISQQCDKPITPVAMYKATVNEGDLKIISWINAENQIAICSITQGSGGSQIITTPSKTTPPKTTTTSTIAPTASINIAVIVVEVTLASPPDKNIEQIISNVNASLSYVTNMDLPKETSLVSPGITVVLIQDMQVQSGWYSVGIPASGIYGNYTIKVKPYDDFNISRPFVVLTRVMDPTEKEVSVKRTEVKVS